MNTEDQTLRLVEDFLGEDDIAFDTDASELLDADWDADDDLDALG